MILTISLFFLGITLAFAMIARKIWMLRTGQILPGTYEEADWTDISVEGVRGRLIELLKFGIHYTVLYTLKAWILVSHFIKKCDRYIRERLTHIIHKNAHKQLDTSISPSGFLQSMREHKEELVSQREKEDTAETEAE